MPSDNRYKKGDRCLVKGLRGRPELNHCIVEVLAQPSRNHPDRYKTMIVVSSQTGTEDVGRVLGLKELNLCHCELKWNPLETFSVWTLDGDGAK